MYIKPLSESVFAMFIFHTFYIWKNKNEYFTFIVIIIVYLFWALVIL